MQKSDPLDMSYSSKSGVLEPEMWDVQVVP